MTGALAGVAAAFVSYPLFWSGLIASPPEFSPLSSHAERFS
jgi:hypothetical protein